MAKNHREKKQLQNPELINLTAPSAAKEFFGDSTSRKIEKDCKLAVIRESDGKTVHLKAFEGDIAYFSNGFVTVG